MCSGKSTLGSSLAKRLGYCFVDLDKVIEMYSQRTISEIFAQNGESEFRKIEQKVLFDVVKQAQTEEALHRGADANKRDPNGRGTIIACGGGTPCCQDNLAFMKAHGFVVYLEVSPEILCERLLVTSPEARPLLPHRDPAVLLHHICNLLAKRKPFYEAAHWKC